MGEDKNNDNEKVLRFDLPIKFGAEEMVAHCGISRCKGARSREELVAKVNLVQAQHKKCMRECARLLCLLCEMADGPGEVSGFALAFLADNVRAVNDVYQRYLVCAMGKGLDDLARLKEKIAARAAGESGSEAGSAAKKD